MAISLVKLMTFQVKKFLEYLDVAELMSWALLTYAGCPNQIVTKLIGLYLSSCFNYYSRKILSDEFRTNPEIFNLRRVR